MTHGKRIGKFRSKMQTKRLQSDIYTSKLTGQRLAGFWDANSMLMKNQVMANSKYDTL